MIVVAKVNLANARAELGFTQAQVAQLANVSKPTVINAEKGQPIQRIQAHRILTFLNRERVAVGKSVLSIDDLDWKIRSK